MAGMKCHFENGSWNEALCNEWWDNPFSTPFPFSGLIKRKGEASTNCWHLWSRRGEEKNIRWEHFEPVHFFSGVIERSIFMTSKSSVTVPFPSPHIWEYWKPSLYESHATPIVIQEPVVLASPRSWLEMQSLRPHSRPNKLKPAF